jgi:hypothetical protein
MFLVVTNVSRFSDSQFLESGFHLTQILQAANDMTVWAIFRFIFPLAFSKASLSESSFSASSGSAREP